MRVPEGLLLVLFVDEPEAAGFFVGAFVVRPPHSPTPVPVLTVSGAAGAKANSLQFLAVETIVASLHPVMLACRCLLFILLLPVALVGDEIAGKKPSRKGSIQKGIEWLSAHQSPDGSWGDRESPLITSLAVLAYVTHNHGADADGDHNGKAVAKARRWLIAFLERPENQRAPTAQSNPGTVMATAAATAALAEIVAVQGVSRTRPDDASNIARLVAMLEDYQTARGDWPWASPTSESGRFVFYFYFRALGAANSARIEEGACRRTLQRAGDYCRRLRRPDGEYVLGETLLDPISFGSLAAELELVTGTGRNDLRSGLTRLIEFFESNRPATQSDSTDLIPLHTSMRAALHYGGNAWTRFNRATQDSITEAQSEDGSWPVFRNPGLLGLQSDTTSSGAAFRTALGILCIAPFRILPRRITDASDDAPQR